MGWKCAGAVNGGMVCMVLTSTRARRLVATGGCVALKPGLELLTS